MKHHTPRRFTILISRTGKEPIVLSCPHLIARLSVALSMSLLVIVISSLLYTYTRKTSQLVYRNSQLSHSNSQLARRNSTLSQEAMSILQRLETLETEIQKLRKRAGLSQDEPYLPNEQSAVPQDEANLGGRAETVLDVVNLRLPNLIQQMRYEVKPTLIKLLAREEARPKGTPLKEKVEISSGYGWRSSPFGENGEFHQGIDFVAAYGSPVHATASGTVEEASWDAGFGNHVVVEHGYGYRTVYAHLSAIQVVKGVRVKRYQIVGYLGNTGRSSGPHLHYSVYHNDQAIDPKPYIN